jgi:DnaJ-class molecular chaperone
MPARDYYEVLGVSRSATADEIRRAHRKLALQYHPDRNKAKDAPAKFAEIQQAYEVLSDDAKRKQYDDFVRLGGSPESFGSGASAAGANAGAGPFGGAWPGDRSGERSGSSNWNADPQTFESIFGDLFGGGARGQRSQAGHGSGQSQRQRARARERMEYEAHVPLETALRGGKHFITIDGQRFELDVPAGISDEEYLSVPGKLDAVIRVHIGDHAWIERDERDLSYDLPISIVEATLGASVDAPLPAGGTVTLKIPAGTASGKKIRIPGRGYPASNGRPAGDLYVVVQIVPPKEPNALTTQLLQEVGRSIENPRARAPWATRGGS